VSAGAVFPVRVDDEDLAVLPEEAGEGDAEPGSSGGWSVVVALRERRPEHPLERGF
jgi:hypothetical protein